MVRQYLTEMKDLLMISKLELTSVLRFEFLRIVCDHEHFMPLNLPFDYGDMSFEALAKKHPLATIIIYEVIETIKSCNLKAAAIAIGCLYDIVCKAAFDKRYQDLLRKERVASIFFLLLQLLITQYHSVSPWYAEASVQDRRELLSCVLFILRTCNRTMLRKWWCSESPRCHHIFLQILVNCVKTFEFDPTLTRATKSLLTPQVALFMKQVGTPEMTELLKGLARQLNAEERASLEDKRLRQLSAEAHTLVLDVIEDFMEDFSQQLNDYAEKNTVMEQVVKLLATLLRVKQSEPVTHLVYASLRAFCHRFKETLFLGMLSFPLSFPLPLPLSLILYPSLSPFYPSVYLSPPRTCAYTPGRRQCVHRKDCQENPDPPQLQGSADQHRGQHSALCDPQAQQPRDWPLWQDPHPDRHLPFEPGGLWPHRRGYCSL